MAQRRNDVLFKECHEKCQRCDWSGISEFKVMVGAALNVGVTPIEIKEVVYQSVPYGGMARAFDGPRPANVTTQEETLMRRKVMNLYVQPSSS
jgi:alkylhydroperoxidase/carboxymuconolactone decarboxylase family protein YurZ